MPDPLLHTSEPWYDSPAEPIQRFNLTAARRPQRYVTGDAMYGWRIVDEKPDPGNNLTWQGQNFLRDRLNTLENPRGLLGANPRWVAENKDLIEAARGTPATEGDAASLGAAAEGALASLIPFVSPGLNDLRDILEQTDPDWSGMREWKAWEAEYPDVAQFLVEARGFKPEEMLSGTRNRDAFMLTINMEMTKAQIQQDIDEYEKNAGTYSAWTQFIGGGAIRNFLMDSDAGKSIGLIGAGKLVSGAGKAAGLNTLAAATRPGAAHTFLAKNLKLGTAGALAVEGAVTGAAWSAQHQAGMQDVAEWLGQSELEFDYVDTLKAGAIGSVFGLGLYGAVRAVGALGSRGVDSQSGVREAMRQAGLEGSPLDRHGLTPEGLTVAALEEDALVKINRALSESTDSRLGFMLSEASIVASGRTIPEVGAFVSHITTLRRYGIRVSDDALLETLDDFLNQGTLKHLNVEDRLKVEKAVAQEELLRIRQSNPAWRAQTQAQFDRWFDVRDRVSALPTNATLDQLNAALQGTGVRLKTAIPVDDLVRQIDTQMATLDNMLNVPADTKAAAKAVAGDKIIEGEFAPKSVAGKLIGDLLRQVTIIAEQRALGGAKSGNAIKAAREEIKRLSVSLNNLYGAPAPKVRRKVEKAPNAKALDQMTTEEQDATIDRFLDLNVIIRPSEVMSGTTAASRVLRSVGYDGPLKKWLLDRTPLSHIANSQHAYIRNFSEMFFGTPNPTTQTAAGIGGAGRNLLAAHGRALHEPHKIRHFLESFATRSDVSREAFQRFNDDVMDAARIGKMPKGIPFEKEAQQLYSMLRDYTGQVIQRGLQNKSLKMRKNWRKALQLPTTVNQPVLRARFDEATELLMRAWQREAASSNTLHREYLEALNWAEQPTNQFLDRSGVIRYKQDGPLAGFEGRKAPTKADLDPESLKLYEETIQSTERVRLAAQRFWSQQLREKSASDSRVLTSRIFGPDGRRYGSNSLTPQFVASNVELKEFFVSDVFTLVEDFALTAGFKTHIGDMMQRTLGVPATLGQVLKAWEKRGRKLFSGEPEAMKEIAVSIDKAYDLVAQLGGFLPHMNSDISATQRYAFDALNKLAAIPVMAGLGAANATEGMVRMFTMIHSPADVGRNAKSFVRSLFASKGFRREELAGMWHDTRAMSALYAHQLGTGRMDDAYELTTRGKLMLPWRDAWAMLTKRQQSDRYQNRFAAAAMSALDGVGKLSFAAGLGPRIQQATEIMMANAAQREMLRFADATIKLRDILKTNPIDPSDADAANKAFIAAARKAGFGDRWDVAQRIVRYDLIEDGMVESLVSASGGNKQAKLNDLFNHYAAMPDGPEKTRLYEATQRYRQFVDDRIKEELGETTAWTTRTGQRNPIQRALDIFTNYSHNVYAYKLAQPASMPSRAFLGILTGFIVAEILQSTINEFLQGSTEEDLLAKWDNPIGAIGQIVSTSARAPIFGGMSFISKPIADSVNNVVQENVGNPVGSTFQPTFGGVVGGAVGNLWRMGQGTSQWAFAITEDGSERGKDKARNAALKYIPLVNSLYGKTAVRMFTDWKDYQSRGSGRSLAPVGDGRSIWGDEEVIVPKTPVTPTTPQPETGFDLREALTRKQ